MIDGPVRQDVARPDVVAGLRILNFVRQQAIDDGLSRPRDTFVRRANQRDVVAACSLAVAHGAYEVEAVDQGAIGEHLDLVSDRLRKHAPVTENWLGGLPGLAAVD